MSRRRRGERLPRTRLPGMRSADSHTRQTDQAIPAIATNRRRRLRPLPRPDAFDPPAQSPCPPRWCPFISPGFGATIRLRGPLRHVLHTHHTTERFYNPTRAKAPTQHKPSATHSTTAHMGDNQGRGTHMSNNQGRGAQMGDNKGGGGHMGLNQGRVLTWVITREKGCTHW